MKNFLITALIFVSFQMIAQDFAPIGASWYYTENFAFSGEKGYLKIESVKDTLVQGKKCKLLAKTGVLMCSNRVESEIVYAQDSAVYFWDKDFNMFQKLYDFKSVVGSQWSILVKEKLTVDTIKVTVDSITATEILKKPRKVLYVSYSPSYSRYETHYSSKIVYSVGDFTYLFNFYPSWAGACDFNFSGGLRCYEDPDFGYYSTGLAPYCTYTDGNSISGFDATIYQAFRSDRTYLYDKNTTVVGVRFDRVEVVGTDSIFYPYRTFCRVDSTRADLSGYRYGEKDTIKFSTLKSSWIGPKVIVKSDGYNLFFNRFNDTIRINTKTFVGDSWKIWSHDTLSLWAKHVSDEKLKIFGTDEKVRVFQIYSYDSKGFETDSLNHRFVIKLSEKYGLIQMPNFYHFPYFSDDSADRTAKNYTLLGITNPKLGYQNLTWLDVNDYQPGDEFHIQETNFSSSIGREVKYINKYLERTDRGDSIQYSLIVKKNTYTFTDKTNVFSVDTLKSVYRPDATFDMLPGEFYTQIPYLNSLKTYYMFATDARKKYPHEYDFSWQYNQQDSTWFRANIIFDGGYYEYYYWEKNLGGPYWSYSDWLMMGGGSRTLEYFQSGDSIYGTPFINLGIRETRPDKSFNVSFNKLSNTITISSNIVHLFENDLCVYNTLGKVTYHQELTDNKKEIDVSTWLRGVYIIQIQSKSGNTTGYKVVLY